MNKQFSNEKFKLAFRRNIISLFWKLKENSQVVNHFQNKSGRKGVIQKR